MYRKEDHERLGPQNVGITLKWLSIKTSICQIYLIDHEDDWEYNTKAELVSGTRGVVQNRPSLFVIKLLFFTRSTSDRKKPKIKITVSSKIKNEFRHI